MARFRYRCPSCDGTVPAERVEEHVGLSGGEGVGGRAARARITRTLVCEACDAELIRERYTPPRREVRAD